MLVNLDESDITNIVAKMKKNTNATEKEIFQTLSDITNFSNMESMKEFSDILAKNNIGSFYFNGVTSSAAFEYLNKKGILNLNKTSPSCAFILDKENLEFLTSLDKVKFNQFKTDVKNGTIKLVNLSGTNIEINGKIYSNTIFSRPKDLEQMTESILTKKKINPNFDVDSAIIKQTKEILGDDVDIMTVSLNKKAMNANDILTRINSNMPTEKQTEALLEVVSEYADNSKHGKTVLGRYFYHSERPMSLRSTEMAAKNQGEIIEFELPKGKTMDDIMYIIPEKGKSFEMVNYIYRKANDVDGSQFMYFNGTFMDPPSKQMVWDGSETGIHISEFRKKMKGKVLVLLDDVSGTASTLTAEDFLRAYKNNGVYKNIMEMLGEDTTIIYAPMFSTRHAKDNMTKWIKGENRSRYKNRTDKDFIATTVIDELYSNGSTFDAASQKILREMGCSDEEIKALHQIFRRTHQGNGRIAINLSWPWTVNANDSGPAGVMAEFMLPKTHAEGANQVRAIMDKGKDISRKYTPFENIMKDINTRVKELEQQ